MYHIGYIRACFSVAQGNLSPKLLVCVQVQPELSTTEAKDKFPKGVEVYKVPSEREYMRFVRRAPHPPAPSLPRAATARPPPSEHLCIPRLTRAFSPSADTRPKMSPAAARRTGAQRVRTRTYARACVLLGANLARFLRVSLSGPCAPPIAARAGRAQRTSGVAVTGVWR